MWSLLKSNRRLRAKVAILEGQLKQQRELHAEWLATMEKMHSAALESLERVRADEIRHRAHAEAAFETVNGQGGFRR